MTPKCRLYLITPPVIADMEGFATRFEAALEAGDVACVQLRLKGLAGAPVDDGVVLEAADHLLAAARRHDVTFLINDRPDLAQQAGADGVHIGQGDACYGDARALLGEAASIGVTCHGSRDLALKAGGAGADYVAFGAFYPSQTKTTQDLISMQILAWWQRAVTLPCVAIGGITAQNCQPLVSAGADFLAVSAAVWNHPEGAAAGVRAMNDAIAAAPGEGAA